MYIVLATHICWHSASMQTIDAFWKFDSTFSSVLGRAFTSKLMLTTGPAAKKKRDRECVRE
jgi:hypothetical protein